MQDKSRARQDKFVHAMRSRTATRAGILACLSRVDKTIHPATQPTAANRLKTSTCAKLALGIVLATT